MQHREPERYTEINARTIDGWVKNGWTWGIPISHEDYVKAQNGEWDVVLTAVKPVPKSWFPLPWRAKRF